MKLKVREDAIYLIIAFLTVTVCFVYAFTAFSNVNFSAINGTYQNYNVIRRFLAGQVPFHDFTVYLGYGHVLLGSFFTYFFGNNYAASQVAMLFISCLCVYSLFFVTAKAILGNWRPAVVFAGLLIMFRVIAVMATGIDFKIVQEFMSQIYFSVGNSARLVRAFILPLSVIELGGGKFLY